jgi:glutaredoxin-related protein
MSDAQQRIEQLVKGSDVVLFMKGDANFPQCGFSGRAIQILKACGVDPKSVTTVNVLEDDVVRTEHVAKVGDRQLEAARLRGDETAGFHVPHSLQRRPLL